MPRFPYSAASRGRLDTCEPRLIELYDEVAEHVNTRVLEGARPLERQQQLFREGKSQIDGVERKGNHNYTPSRAVDAGPYPIVWPTPLWTAIREALQALPNAGAVLRLVRQLVKVVGRWYYFAGFVRGLAAARGIPIRQGADWDGDFELRDQRFDDLPHTELIVRKGG